MNSGSRGKDNLEQGDPLGKSSPPDSAASIPIDWNPELASIPPEAKFVFENMDDEDVLDRLVVFSLLPEDPWSVLPECLKDQRRSKPPEEAVYRRVVGFLLNILRYECAVDRRNVVERVERIVTDLLDGAQHGSTVGEQKFAIRFRHPGSAEYLPKNGQSRADARSLRNREDLLDAVHLLRRFDSCLKKVSSVLPLHKTARRRNAPRIARRLAKNYPAERFPRLASRIEDPRDVEGLTRETAARLVFSDAIQPPVGPEALEERLTKARATVQEMAFIRDRSRRTI